MAKEVEFERRRYPRKQVDIITLLKVGLAHSGRGHTKDISIKGVCLECPSLFARLTYKRAVELFMGVTIKIVFPQEALTVEGKVKRVEPSKNELGILVERTTNDTVWSKICREEADA